MCGIAGLVGRIEEQTFLKSLNTLTHRGPDGWGIYQDDDITFGHRRLSIIDLSDCGKQPMEVLERYVITFNGEIYNYLEIREELVKLGHQFKSHSDTEVLLFSYVQWGPSCVRKFNGMWAFAIWDKQEKKLFMSRDRMGKKPLFYAYTRFGFAFASEMKAIYPLLDSVEVNTDTLAMAEKNIFSYEGTEHCLIKGIYRFPAASNGFLNEQLKTEKYWSIENELIDVPERYEEQVEMFFELFKDACRIRMRSDVPVGTALSGGLDSSATISMMAHVSRNIAGQDFSHDWQHAYVAGFPGSAIDESAYAKKVVDNLGIKATYLNIDPLKDIEKLPYYFYLFEDLYLTSPIPMIQLYGEVRKNGTIVTLDGHGADELFGGYPSDILHKTSEDYPNFFKIRGTISAYMNAMRETGEVQKLRHSVFHYRKRRGERRANPSYTTSLNGELRKSTFEGVLPTLLRNYDRYSMINGIEIRMPFLDYRIVSFAFSIPASSKIRNGFTKAIVRDGVQSIVPRDVVYRKDKIGFNSPISEWLRGPLKPWINDIISSSSFAQSQIVDQAKIRQRLSSLFNGANADFTQGEKLWIDMIPYFWEQSLKYAETEGANSPVRI